MSLLTPSRRIPAALALAAVLALTAPVLAGCGLVGSTIENATGGDIDLGGTSVPDDFPADVPLIDGEVLSGAGIGSGGDKVWNVAIKVSGPEAYEAIKAQLLAAGFDDGGIGGQTADGAAATFTKDPYAVGLLIVQQDADWVANYTVTATSAN